MDKVEIMIFGSGLSDLIIALLLIILGEMLIGVFITARMSVWWIRRHIRQIAVDLLTEIANDPQTINQLQEMVKKMMPQMAKSMSGAQIRNMAISSVAQVLLGKLGSALGGIPPEAPKP